MESMLQAGGSPATARLIRSRDVAVLSVMLAACALFLLAAAIQAPPLEDPEALSPGAERAGRLASVTATKAWSLTTPGAVPGVLAAAMVALGLLSAPFFALREGEPGADARRHLLARGFFFAAWQAAGLGYFLLLAARMEPLAGEAILRCMGFVFASAFLSLALAQRFPRPYAGIVFFWAIGVPLGCYFVAELFLLTPAGMSMAAGAAPEADRLHGFLRWSLTFSPGTAAVAGLHGRFPGGIPCGWLETIIFSLCAIAAGTGMLWKTAKAPASKTLRVAY